VLIIGIDKRAVKIKQSRPAQTNTSHARTSLVIPLTRSPRRSKNPHAKSR
jgi:hypothetical protein